MPVEIDWWKKYDLCNYYLGGMCNFEWAICSIVSDRMQTPSFDTNAYHVCGPVDVVCGPCAIHTQRRCLAAPGATESDAT